ncbi:hypothetical protein K402DRAFT_323601, partial [Aulographum hederae CBS 113979]
ISSLVFSFWTSTLNIVGTALSRAGIEYTRIDGQMSQKNRIIALQKLRTDDSTKVLLLSLSCGAVGLNLTAASRVYLMEPHWNPSIEEQALARVHRIGQTKPVTTVRFIMRDTYEEHVVKVQDRKKNLTSLLLFSKKESEATVAHNRIHVSISEPWDLELR